MIILLINAFKNVQLRTAQEYLTMEIQLTPYQSVLLMPIVRMALMQMIKLGCVLVIALIINGNMAKNVLHIVPMDIMETMPLDFVSSHRLAPLVSMLRTIQKHVLYNAMVLLLTQA